MLVGHNVLDDTKVLERSKLQVIVEHYERDDVMPEVLYNLVLENLILQKRCSITTFLDHGNEQNALQDGS